MAQQMFGFCLNQFAPRTFDAAEPFFGTLAQDPSSFGRVPCALSETKLSGRRDDGQLVSWHPKKVNACDAKKLKYPSVNSAQKDIHGVQVQNEDPKLTCMTMAGPVLLPGNPPIGEAEFSPDTNFINAIHRVQESRLPPPPARYFPY